MPRLLGTPLAADLEATAGACHAVMPGGRVLLGCGFWDNSIRHVLIPWSHAGLRIVQGLLRATD